LLKRIFDFDWILQGSMLDKWLKSYSAQSLSRDKDLLYLTNINYLYGFRFSM